MLTQRLQGLEDVSIVRRKRLPPPAASNVYELTEWGLESEDMIKFIGRWAARSPSMKGGKPMSINSVILSFRTMFDAQKAGKFNAVIGLRFGDDEFLARVSRRVLDISRDDATQGDAVITCDQNALVAVIYGGMPLDEMVKLGEIDLTGKSSLVEGFCKLFPLPASAPDFR